MERLIADANRVKEANGEMGDLTVTKFADVVEAIHIIQGEMGVTGATAQEAEHTISGSAASMKAAFDNFMVAMVDDNADVGESFDELKSTVGIFLDNITPKIWDFVGSLGPVGPSLAGITSALVAFKAAAAISKVIGAAAKAFEAYKKANEGATVAQWLMNAAMNANPIVLIVTLIAGLVAALVVLWNTNEDFRNALISAWEAIKDAATKIFSAVADFFTKTIPDAFNKVLDWFKDVGKKFANIGKNIVDGLKNGISNAWSNLKKWFTGIWDDLFGGIGDFFSGIFGGRNAKISVDGSHRSGLDYVPYDGYIAELHKGERVLTASEASGYGGTSIGNININIDGAKYSDEQSLASAIALEIQNMTDRRAAVYA